MLTRNGAGQSCPKPVVVAPAPAATADDREGADVAADEGGLAGALGHAAPVAREVSVPVLQEAGQQRRGLAAAEARGRLGGDRVVAGGQVDGADAVVVQDAEVGAGGGARARRGGGAQGQRRNQRGESQGDRHGGALAAGHRKDEIHVREPTSADAGRGSEPDVRLSRRSARGGRRCFGEGALTGSPVGRLTRSLPASPGVRTIPAADARTSQAQPALHARARRAESDRGPCRHRLPPRIRVGSRGAARGRDLLHAERLSDHRHPALAALEDRPHQARPLLAGARPAAAAGAVRDAGAGRRLGHRLRPGADAVLPRLRRLLGLLLQQLAADPRRRLLLRPLRSPRPAQPPLVAGGRGAVLHRLAVPAPARDQGRQRAPAALRGAAAAGDPHARPRLRLGDPDGGPLPPRRRPLAGLLRDRHPRLGAALRRRPGDGLAEPQTEPPDLPAGAQNARPARRSPAWSRSDS